MITRTIKLCSESKSSRYFNDDCRGIHLYGPIRCTEFEVELVNRGAFNGFSEVSQQSSP